MLLKVWLTGAAGTAARLVGVLPLAVAVYASPVTLLVLNTFGCGVAGMVVARVAPNRLRMILAHGVLGAFTTFSAVIVAAGRIGHSLGLVAEDTSRMTGVGLLLAFFYVSVSVVAGLLAFRFARRMARR